MDLSSKSNAEILHWIFVNEPERVKKWLELAQKFINIYYKGANKTITAEDIISDIIVKVADEDRKWNGFTYEKADAYMYNTIQSHARNLAKKETREVVVEDSHGVNEEEETDFITDNDILTLEEILISEDRRELLKIIYTEIEKDTDMGLVFLCMKQQMENREIAADLNIEVKEVVNIKRKIQYRIGKKFKNI